MRNRWMLAATILLSGCAMVKTTSFGTTLILKPQIQAGSYSTNTVVNPYTQASINHLILKIYTFDGTEHDQGIQKSIPNADLGKSITFTNLKANTTYRIKAYAYFTADESQPISTTDANSYTDVTLLNDDHPAIAALKVKLIDIAFNGQGTGSLQITNGGYSYASSESLTVPCVVSTFAGGGGATAAGYLDGQGTAAQFTTPQRIAADNSGNVYVADAGNNLIRKITTTGVVSTIAGGAGGTTSGYLEGTGTAAKFNSPQGIAVDGAGNIYVSDFNNHRIRKITSNGVVSTLATVTYPTGIALDGSGNVYAADGNNTIKKITSGGAVSTFAGGTQGFLDGTGTAARFDHPAGVAVDSSGNVYVGDTWNYAIRKITSDGIVTTLAGSTPGYLDGTGTAARLTNPTGVAVDSYGNVFVADQSNNAIRKITSGGVVSTLAGRTTAGYLDGIGTAAKFNGPTGIAVDWAENIFVSDYNSNLIRVLK